MPNLKKLDLNTNKLDSFKEPPTLPALEHLDLGANVIVGADTITHFSDFKKLRNIVVAGNPFADELADKLKQEVLYRLYPVIKIKMIGEDEINEEDLA